MAHAPDVVTLSGDITCASEELKDQRNLTRTGSNQKQVPKTCFPDLVLDVMMHHGRIKSCCDRRRQPAGIDNVSHYHKCNHLAEGGTAFTMQLYKGGNTPAAIELALVAGPLLLL